MSRRRTVIGNWKMNPTTIAEAFTLARARRGTPHQGVELGIAPPSVALSAVAGALRGSDVLVFAQDVHWEEKGAYTGQVSALMLRELAHGAIVGHSEVRRDQGDDDARVAAKATAALRAGLHVIYCLGESYDQRERRETDAVLARQVRDGVAAIDRGALADGERIAVAYEPIWAIGTGEAATPDQAAAAIAVLRAELRRCGLEGDAIPVLYGGSVTGDNAAEFARAEGVDGALVGGASLKQEEFARIVAAFR
ncbi:MAG: triose-phosphate isomerase [Chloroflexota bacterium]|nr:triose-phosphate isomerase [Chloroflexota bacterium]